MKRTGIFKVFAVFKDRMKQYCLEQSRVIWQDISNENVTLELSQPEWRMTGLKTCLRLSGCVSPA